MASSRIIFKQRGIRFLICVFLFFPKESQMEEGVQQIDMLQDRVAQQEEQLVGQQVTIENLTAQLKVCIIA